MSNLEQHFQKYRKHIIGNGLSIEIDGEKKNVLYADWTASGRLYGPIEDFISNELGQYVANTHTETTLTGTTMTHAYHEAQDVIKNHVNATEDDVLITEGSGMTAVINKFQRILGLRVPEQLKSLVPRGNRPLVIVTHMEHYSNHATWGECHVDVQILKRDNDTGLPCLDHLEELLEKNKHREQIIGSFSGCSNVTGILNPIHEMAEILHKHNRLCFVDFAASGPYVKIDMHPENPLQKLDAIFLSPHKFLGGPGSSGVLVFDKNLYNIKTPDHPGGGTIHSVNSWGQHTYLDDIETREDGGTPGFLQAIKTALAIKLKEDMGIENIHHREEELREVFVNELTKHDSIELLESQQMNRLCILSFYSFEQHHNLIVKILNDRFGIQTRGGVSCAGTYGQILLKNDKKKNVDVGCKVPGLDSKENTGWVRVSLHPTMTNDEAIFIAQTIHKVIDNYDVWSLGYTFDQKTGEFHSVLSKPIDYIGLESFKATN